MDAKMMKKNEWAKNVEKVKNLEKSLVFIGFLRFEWCQKRRKFDPQSKRKESFWGDLVGDRFSIDLKRLLKTFQILSQLQ